MGKLKEKIIEKGSGLIVKSKTKNYMYQAACSSRHQTRIPTLSRKIHIFTQRPIKVQSWLFERSQRQHLSMKAPPWSRYPCCADSDVRLYYVRSMHP